MDNVCIVCGNNEPVLDGMCQDCLVDMQFVDDDCVLKDCGDLPPCGYSIQELLG